MDKTKKKGRKAFSKCKDSKQRGAGIDQCLFREQLIPHRRAELDPDTISELADLIIKKEHSSIAFLNDSPEEILNKIEFLNGFLLMLNKQEITISPNSNINQILTKISEAISHEIGFDLFEDYGSSLISINYKEQFVVIRKEIGNGPFYNSFISFLNDSKYKKSHKKAVELFWRIIFFIGKRYYIPTCDRSWTSEQFDYMEEVAISYMDDHNKQDAEDLLKAVDKYNKKVFPLIQNMRSTYDSTIEEIKELANKYHPKTKNLIALKEFVLTFLVPFVEEYPDFPTLGIFGYPEEHRTHMDSWIPIENFACFDWDDNDVVWDYHNEELDNMYNGGAIPEIFTSIEIYDVKNNKVTILVSKEQLKKFTQLLTEFRHLTINQYERQR